MKKTGGTALTEARLRKLARFEISFPEAAGTEEKTWQELSVKKAYAATPEDLLAALDQADTMPFAEMKKLWALPLWHYGPALFKLFHTTPAGGVEGYPGLPDEAAMTAAVWEDMLMDAAEDQWQASAYRSRLQSIIRMREQPVPLRVYEDAVKESYIDYYFAESRLQEASEKELLLYVLYADELAGRKNLTALRAKARGCFGGDKAYACNWARARDLYLQLMELDEDPCYAAMLGHIYYSGRVGEKPDYAKAFYYYSIGALGGHDEARLRLSDMFLKGEGTIKNEFISHKLIWEQYEELLPFLAEGVFDTRFAEAAWRAGEALRRNGALEEDYKQALAYFLQAELALKERRKIREGEAEERLQQDLALSLQAVRAKLPATGDQNRQIDPAYLFEALSELYEAPSLFLLEHKALAGGKRKLTVKRLNGRGEEAPMLLTLPEQQRCFLTDKLELELSGISSWDGREGQGVAFNAYADGAFTLGGQAVLNCAGNWKIKLPKES